MSKRVVLTVSGVIAADIREQIASGKRPRADYLELARSFNADLLDYAAARTIAGRMGAVLEKLGGPNLVLAYACWKVRKNCQAIVTDGEQIGLPLAALLKFTPGTRPRHLMIVHVISEPKKTVFLDWLGVQSAIDRFITYSRWQQRFIEERWKLGREPRAMDALHGRPGILRTRTGHTKFQLRVRRSVPSGWSAATTKPCCEQWRISTCMW